MCAEKLTKVQDVILKYIAGHIEHAYELPTVEQIVEALGKRQVSVRRSMTAMEKNGQLRKVRLRLAYLQKIKQEQEALFQKGFSSSFVPPRSGIRTGVHDLPRKNLKERAYLLDRIDFHFSGAKVEYVFVVSTNRGFQEYSDVRRQLEQKGKLSPYQQDLYYSMFKNW